MRSYLIVLGWLSAYSLLGWLSAPTARAQSAIRGPQLTFVDKSHDFGDVEQGEQVSHTFQFANTGTEPLQLTDVKTTCGCTATDWTRTPVPPGGIGQVAATFNSTGKRNAQRKVISVYSNATNPQETVVLVVNVVPKKQ